MWIMGHNIPVGIDPMLGFIRGELGWWFAAVLNPMTVVLQRLKSGGTASMIASAGLEWRE